MKDPNTWNDYSLNRVGKSHENFNSIVELKEAIKRNGLPSKLADFDIRNFDKQNGYIKNSYQSWSVIAYPPI